MNLITILGKYYPNVQVHCVGADIAYANLVWDGGDPLPTEAELTALQLADIKAEQISMLSEQCQQSICGGFQSSGLGSPTWYDSEEVDQLNLVGASLSTGPTPTNPDGTSIEYAVRPINGDGSLAPKTYVSHTHDQLKTVLGDGAQVKLQYLQKFNTKRDYINNQTSTIAEVLAVTWESTP